MVTGSNPVGIASNFNWLLNIGLCERVGTPRPVDIHANVTGI
jgi:hypothetical protein